LIGPGWYEARQRARRTLRSIAEEAGCSPAFLCDIEHGRRNPSATMDAKLRAALGLPPAEPKLVGPLCVVCGRELAPRHRHHQAIADPNGVIGPGYQPLRGAWSEPDGFSCSNCGLHYDSAPVRP
jgi:transcriptional regulator with XRE-family HTH domain